MRLEAGGLFGLELDAAGRIYIATTRQGQAIVARLDADGGRDTSFGVQGIASAKFSTPSKGGGLALTPDGKVVLACVVQASSKDLGLVRFDVGGVLDPSFGDGGHVHLDRPGDQELLFGGVVYDPAG